jgi:hypothetical protein
MTEENEGEKNETRNPFLFLHDNGMMPLSHYGQDIDHLRELLQNIHDETGPVSGHPDPMSVRDSWNQVFDQLDKLQGEGD